MFDTEVNPQFAAIVPPTDIVLVIVFEIDLETTSGSVTICLPYAAIEPIMPKLKAHVSSQKSRKSTGSGLIVCVTETLLYRSGGGCRPGCYR